MKREARTTIVTGGTRGIGRSIAERLAARGDRICLAGSANSIDLAQSIASELRKEHGVDVLPLAVDLRQAQSCQDAIDAVLAEFGRLDVLVNNAGINYRATAADSTESEWTKVIDTNVNGTFRMLLAAYPALRDTKGNVVNMGSTAGFIAVHGSAAYAVSKAAISHLTRVLALEWGSDGIRVNAVGPTIVPTDMTTELFADLEYMDAKLSTIPLGEVVLPSDVADAVVWLSSDEARMITGQTIYVDGGVTVA